MVCSGMVNDQEYTSAHRQFCFVILSDERSEESKDPYTRRNPHRLSSRARTSVRVERPVFFTDNWLLATASLRPKIYNHPESTERNRPK